MQDAAWAQERAHLQSSCKSLTQGNCRLETLLVDAKQKIKEMQQTDMTRLGNSIESYGAERAGLPPSYAHVQGKVSSLGFNTAVLGHVLLHLVRGQHPADDVM